MRSWPSRPGKRLRARKETGTRARSSSDAFRRPIENWPVEWGLVLEALLPCVLTLAVILVVTYSLMAKFFEDRQ